MKKNLLFNVERPVYSFEELKKEYSEEKVKFNMLESMKNQMRCKQRSISSIGRLILPLPFILASFYTLKFLVHDIIAGFTMVVFHIPQGLAYGLLSGIQPVNGLYSSFFPSLVYAFFGTSRHISFGTFSIISMLSSVPVLREVPAPMQSLINDTMNSTINQDLNSAYEMDKLQVSIATTILAGILQIAMGMLQFGRLMSYMSDALIDAFTSAASIHVVMSQIPNLLGYSIRSYSGIGEFPYKTYLFLKHLHQIHWPTVIVSAICIIILIIFTDYINPYFKKKFRFPLPIQFAIVVFATVISYLANINGRFQIKIVGQIPKGMPYPMVPDISIWPKIFTDAILLAVIGFVMNSSLAKVFALRFSYDVNYNQEAFAYGLSNVVGSFFQCTMSAAALARTAVVVEVGMKSQIASLISCLGMVFILLFIGPLFTSVPRAALSAIIVVSLKSMLKQVLTLPKLWHLSKYDFLVWIVTYLATLFMNVPYGLVFGFIFSLMTVLIRIQNPKSQILGQIPNTDIYRNIKIFKDAREIPGIKIFRYDAPLYFANSEHFQSKIYKKTGLNSQNSTATNLKDVSENTTDTIEKEDLEKNLKYSEPERLRFIIVDCSSINYIDNVGIRILNDIYKSCQKLKVSLYLASPNASCRHILQRAKFAQENRNRICFLTVHDAVLSTGIAPVGYSFRHMTSTRNV